jgi:hypothetical protein
LQSWNPTISPTFGIGMPGISTRLKGIVALAALATLGATALAQSLPPTADSGIVTDRPDVTESSIVVPNGSLQLENGMTWTSNHGVNTFDFPETLIRLGVSTQRELRIVVPNYLSGLSGREPTSGFGDIGLGLKQQLGPLRGGFDLAVIVAVSLPTGAGRVSSHGFDPFVKLPWSKSLKSGWSIGGMQSAFWHTEDGKRSLTWEPTFYIEKEVAKPWDVFIEYAGDFARRVGSQQIAHVGTAYRFTPRHQVDFHFGFGLTDGAPARFFAVGYSFRIDKVWER